MNSLLAALLPQKSMPPPDPRCRTYDFAQTVELFRNHETQVRMSRELHRTQINPRKPQ